MTGFFPWIVFFFLPSMAKAYSIMTMPGFIGLKLRNRASGGMTHRFHTWIEHHRVQTWTRLRIFSMRWRKTEHPNIIEIIIILMQQCMAANQNGYSECFSWSKQKKITFDNFLARKCMWCLYCFGKKKIQSLQCSVFFSVYKGLVITLVWLKEVLKSNETSSKLSIWNSHTNLSYEL